MESEYINLKEKDMSSMAVKLTNDHLEQIADYLAEKFPVLRQRSSSRTFSRDAEMDIRERTVRVEEELKNQREIIRDLIVNMNARFEQVDKRFEEMRTDMNTRFEEMRTDMDKRFNMMMWFTGLGLTIVIGFLTGAMVLLK